MDAAGNWIDTGEAAPHRVRAEGAGRDRRPIIIGPDADRVRVEPRHSRDGAAEGRRDRDPLCRIAHLGDAQHHPGRSRSSAISASRRTSFAALACGLGIAVGAAWGGLLSNFAAGAFILVLRPFKVGDYVVAGEVEGTVQMIGLFQHHDRRARQRADDGRQCEDHGRYDQESHQQRRTGASSARRSSITASIRPTRSAGCKTALPKIANVGDHPRTRRRDPHLQRTRPGAHGAPVLQHGALLAGFLRYQSDDSRDFRRRRLSGCRGASTACGKGGMIGRGDCGSATRGACASRDRKTPLHSTHVYKPVR